jgi:hypothetical protein
VFEEEAEVHCNKVLCSVCENPTCTKNIKCREWRVRKAGFYCGAEFGYNKVKEWHYLKDDYPTLGTDVLICIKLLNNDKTVKIGSFQQGGGLLIEGFIVSVDTVIAWQPLPNLPAKE